MSPLELGCFISRKSLREAAEEMAKVDGFVSAAKSSVN
jgi:hypothetical protein